MNSMYVLLLTIIGVVLLLWLVQGVRLYRNCKGDIYSDLYGSFLAYAYRYIALRDCSESGYLKAAIGPHKIVFSTISVEENQRTKFCVIFYNRGIMAICYDRVDGRVLGNSASKFWNVIRTDEKGVSHTYRHNNPYKDLKAYVTRLKEIFPDVHIEERLALGNQADFSALKGDVKIIHFSDLKEELSAVQAEFIAEDEVKALYQKLVNG